MSPSRILQFALLGLLPIACGGNDDQREANQPPRNEPSPRDDDGSADRDADGAAAADDAAPAQADGDDAPDADDDGDEAPDAGEAPAGDSLLVPPPPESLTLHGLAAYEVVTIYAKPNLASTKLGYLRFGHRTMVAPKIDDEGEGCPKGWHQLPAGGYACASKGLTVQADKEPYMHQPPPRPRIDEPMPYDYGVVARNGTETWWRTADALERELAAEKFAILQEQEAAAAAAAAEAAGLPPPATKPTKPKPKPAAADAAGGSEPSGDPPAGGPTPLPGLGDLPDEPAEPAAPPTPEELEQQRLRELEAKARAEEQRLREEEERKLRLEKMAKLPLHPEHPFLEKGFTITMALKVTDKGRTWWRTSRGGYLDASKIYRKPTPKIIEVGAQIPEDSGFPFGFARDDKVPVFEREPDGKLRRVRSIDYRTFVDGVEQLEIDGKAYLRTAEDTYVRVSDLRLAEPQTPPAEIAELGGFDRWIDVDLAQQLLVAYEGERPVFATLVSTGRKGPKEEPFDTPTGTFRIQTKHVSSSMDGNTASDGNYSIQDVPWAMFFHGNYALHGAFWHAGFGGRRSHGCINLAVADARWLFWWAGPELPEGWHGAAAHEGAPGSVVVVR